jgi:ABC-type bacteriocin/lantibiotic exporter with double-glycine peptidase domain
LIKPLKGQIFVDGQEIKSLEEIRKYQNLFSISSQDSFLPVDTIKENIIFGSNEEISEKRIKESIKFARLENFIKEIPKGINADIGTNIKQLSSGQKQRISIARSIYSDREILIFDEATNALDIENEKLIFENLKNFKTKKTIIIISHNPDNLKICDSVFRIENKNLVND